MDLFADWPTHAGGCNPYDPDWGMVYQNDCGGDGMVMQPAAPAAPAAVDDDVMAANDTAAAAAAAADSGFEQQQQMGHGDFAAALAPSSAGMQAALGGGLPDRAFRRRPAQKRGLDAEEEAEQAAGIWRQSGGGGCNSSGSAHWQARKRPFDTSAARTFQHTLPHRELTQAEKLSAALPMFRIVGNASAGAHPRHDHDRMGGGIDAMGDDAPQGSSWMQPDSSSCPPFFERADFHPVGSSMGELSMAYTGGESQPAYDCDPRAYL